MLDILRREGVYLSYYSDLRLRQIFWCWVLGMVLGSAVSVFLKDRIHSTFRGLGEKNLGAMKIVLGVKRFALYIGFVILFSLLCGLMINGLMYS